MKNPDTSGGFSLVEVTLALGIVTFCLIAIFSLLPAGLRSAQASAEEAGAAALLSQLATQIRTAKTNASGEFVIGDPLPGTFTYGSSVVFTNQFSLAGTRGSSNARYVGRVQVEAPTNALSPGRALISLAWPAAGPVTWNTSQTNWTNARGSVSAVVFFVPRP
jgi:uncharacterized protein (TIGR02598 family)